MGLGSVCYDGHEAVEKERADYAQAVPSRPAGCRAPHLGVDFEAAIETYCTAGVHWLDIRTHSAG